MARGQIAALDRDYDEYRSENRSKLENEFSTWRSGRQGQRDQLGKVEEHMDVIGSDGTHVGTVDKVRGDRILLTKTDADAGGRHHSIPSRWIATVSTSVTLTKSAEEAKAHWRDEERNQAMLGDRNDGETGRDSRGKILNRSFSGTYRASRRCMTKGPDGDVRPLCFWSRVDHTAASKIDRRRVEYAARLEPEASPSGQPPTYRFRDDRPADATVERR